MSLDARKEKAYASCGSFVSGMIWDSYNINFVHLGNDRPAKTFSSATRLFLDTSFQAYTISGNDIPMLNITVFTSV